MSAELDAVICSGPRRGKQQTYMLLEERAPGAPDLPRDAALAELAARFFAGHGPATEKDLAWWASLTLAEVRAAIGRAGDRLRREEAGGLVLWSSAAEPADDAAPAPGAPVVHLIQGYDEYIMGYAEHQVAAGASGVVVGGRDARGRQARRAAGRPGGRLLAAHASAGTGWSSRPS